MLGILLTILKILGIIILVILGLIILLLVLILFVPVRYRAEGCYEDKVPYIKASVSYMLHMFSAFVAYDSGLKIKVKLLGLTLFDNERKEKKKQSLKKDTAAQTKQTFVQKEGTNEKEEKKSETSSDETVKENKKAEPDIKEEKKSKEACNERKEASDTLKANEQSLKESDERTDKGDDIYGEEDKGSLEGLKGLKDRVEYIKELIENPSTQEAIKLCMDRLGKMLRSVLPKKGYIKADIGLANAGTTGKIMAAYYALYSYIGRVVSITPYYDEEIIRVQMKLKGCIRPINLIYQLVRIYFDKNCNRLIRIILKKDKA